MRRNCLLKHVIEGKREGKIKVTERRGRRRTKLLDELQEKRGYLKLKEEALVHILWRSRFGSGLWTCRKADGGMNKTNTRVF